MRLRQYPLSKDELLVWLLRAYEGRTHAQIAETIGATPPRVAEIDRSMTARALACNEQWNPDEA
jgi:hypothetical protein